MSAVWKGDRRSIPWGCCGGLSGSPGMVSPSASVFSEWASTGTRLVNSQKMRATIAKARSTHAVSPRVLTSMAAPCSSQGLRACCLGDRVEKAVHEPAFALVVEGVRDIDVFRDHRADGHVGSGDQLVRAGSENGA